MASDDVHTLTTLSPGDMVTIDLPTTDAPTQWHVNNVPRIGGGDSVTISAVMQAADASEHWLLAIIIQDENGEVTLDKFVEFKGHPPDGLDAGDHGTVLDFNNVSIKRVSS